MNEVARTLLEAAQEMSGTVLIIGSFCLWGFISERRDRKRSNR